ncbi:hypothetical protein [Streptomyces sp. SID8352]|uniref:hypothetical protein n=1 Tax=Streptomyces sp. SID8352 TaxID=2690338 RepID=UPI001926470A|nr:hypothetical protein [Streptomyces sp. SID8352]
MAGRRRGGDGARPCPACGTPTLAQWVGTTAALHATVDLPGPDEPRPWAAALLHRTPNNLIWCLPRPRYGPLRLRWTHARHPPDCPHQHLTSHTCTPAPTTLF